MEHTGVGDFLNELAEALTPAQRGDDGTIAIIIAIYSTYFAFIICILICQCCVACTYWSTYVKPTQDKWLRKTAIIPQSLMGYWQFGLCDCFSDMKVCCCGCCFPHCLVSETWYRAGWSHGILGNSSDSCTAYYGGCFMICALQSYLGCCFPCVYGILRGGYPVDSDGTVAGVVPLDTRFRIPASFLTSCCTWFFCGPCASCQEFRQVQAAINHQETVLQGPDVIYPGQVMMAPQGQMMNPQGQPMAQPMMGSQMPTAPQMPMTAVGQPVMVSPFPN